MSSIEREEAKKIMEKRIKIATEIAERLFSKNIVDRGSVQKLLMETYREHALQPMRGKAWPEDIWDKEIATIYMVAKQLLRMDEKNPEVFHKLFHLEEILEEASSIILDKSGEEARKWVLFLLGGSINDNTLARLLRVVSTGVLLGFYEEGKLIELMKKIAEIFPEFEKTLRKYAKYFIAMRTAQAIALGIVRDRITKEAIKQALTARISLGPVTPDDKYIEYIARNIFEIPKDKLESILFSQEPTKKKRTRKKKKRSVKRRRKKSAAGS